MKNKRFLAITKNKRLICCICGLEILTSKEVSKEHESPLSRGGNENNWKWAHKKCNNDKGALTQPEYELFLKLIKIRDGVIKE